MNSTGWKWIILFLLLSACKPYYNIRYGDPRKNCNHPEHGLFMNKRLMKKEKTRHR
jgi:hypothetical protein